MAGHMTDWGKLAFLVPLGELRDWRMVLLFDAAVDTGLMEALPGSAVDLAARLGLSEHAVRVVLDGLGLWHVVELATGGVYSLGPSAPDADGTAVLRHHARAIRGWSTAAERLRGEPATPWGKDIKPVEIMLDALAVMGRRSAPGAVDACVTRTPQARRVLDLGGGHGQFAVEFARRGFEVTMQDRPEVVDLAERKGWLSGSGVELFPGDFFETLPAGDFDIVFCAGVVYTFSAERNLALFRQVRPLIAPGGSLAVHTFLRGTDELATLFAAQMLGVPGGDSHSEEDIRSWLEETDYTSVASQRLDQRPEWMLFGSPGGGCT